MAEALRPAGPGSRIDELVAMRTEAGARFFEAESARLSELCHLMAERFARKGRLLALGASPQARSDARHVAVEFVHPVIVGKRALPAIGLAGEGGPVAAQLALVAEPGDIVMLFDGAPAPGPDCLTIGFPGGEWSFDPPSADPFVRQELVETLYHLLWELVHVL